jgi:hypothetical protein
VTKKTPPGEAYVVCVKRDDDDLDLTLHKIYPVLPDARGERVGLIRVVDESGEDYLYPSDYFLAIEPPVALREELRRAS